MHRREDATIELSEDQRTVLEKVARSRRTPQAVAQRARIVLMTADGILPGTIGAQLGVSQPTIRKWRARYVEQGLPGLRSEPRPGRPRTLDDQRVADLLKQALQTRPAKQTHWSVRSFAAEANISKDMAHRLFRAASIAPHRSRSFKLSNDPAFVEEVRDITGLYLNPPITPWCCASMRRARSRRWSARSPCRRWDWATSKASPTTMSVRAPPPCSPRSMWPTVR